MAANVINQLSTANTFQHWLTATESLITRVNLLTNGNGDYFMANTELRVGGAGANVSLNVETSATINTVSSNTINVSNLIGKEIVVTGNVTSETTIAFDAGGSFNFQRKEIVYQSSDATYANAYATAVVENWDTTNRILTISQVNGTFLAANNTYGRTTTAQWVTISTGSGFNFTKPNVAIPSNVNIKRDLFVDGDVVVTGNLTLDTVGFDDLAVSGSGTFGNTLSVTGTTTLSNVTITGNVATLNVTNDTHFANNIYIYKDTTVSGNSTFNKNVQIDGDLTVSGNIILDQIGYDDISANGSVWVGNNLTVIGTTNLTGTTNIVGDVTTGNVTVANTLTANIFVGDANTQIYGAIANVAALIAGAEGTSLAFSIALG